MAQTPEQVAFNQSMNEHTAIYYTACVAGTAGLFITSYAIRTATRYYGPQEKGLVNRVTTTIARCAISLRLTHSAGD
jgi:hypothetical protein